MSQSNWSRAGLRLLPILLALLCVALPATAQEQSGLIEGTVVDSTNAPVPGVTITVTGDGFTRVVVTNERGAFRMPGVPPGVYDAVAELDGFKASTADDVQISLGSRQAINFTIQPDAVEDVIEVTAEAPIISVRQSDTSAVISQEWVENLPTGRDFTSVVSQTASANDEGDLLGGISIDGASGAENKFIIDGMDTTNLQDGTSEKTLVTDFLEEVQVKASGYNAEFGGSTGGVISAVTKSGTNELKGDVHAYYEEKGLLFDERNYSGGSDGRRLNREQAADGTFFSEVLVDDTDEFERFEPGFTLGGPLASDKVWFFLGYSPTFREWTRTLSFPDEGGITQSYNQERDFDYGTANVTANLGSVYLKLAYNVSDISETGHLPGVNGDAPNESFDVSDPEAYAINTEQPNESYSLNADWLVNSNVSINARAGHFEYDTQESGFYTGDWHTFVGFPEISFPDFPSSLASPRSSPRAEGTAFDLFERDFVTGDATFFFDGFGGEHEIKVGGLVENIANDVLDGYVNTRLLFYWDRSFSNLLGERVRGTFGTLRVLQIATQGNVEAENSALYLQDSWRPNGRLTINLGVRAEKERIPSFADNPAIPDTAIGFDYDDKIAPRLGFAYDLKGDGRWKLYGSYGVFYDNTKLELPRGSFGGAKWVDWFFGIETFDWPSLLATCKIERNSIAAGPPAGCGDNFLFAVDRRFPSNDPSDPTIDPNLKPFESNEITLGVEHMLTSKIALGLRYVHKEIERTIEDVGVLDPAIGEVFFIANPGEGVAESILGPNFPDQPRAIRDYDALTLTFRKNFSNNWALNASYTYSELEGNYSGLASSDEDGRLSPNVNRFFDGLQSSFDASGNGQPVIGKLATDRPHQFKAQLIYQTPWGSVLGLDQRVASGTPISTEMDVAPGLPFFPYGRGDLGRTSSITQTDLYVAHEFAVGGGNSIELSMSVFNLFDEGTAIDVFNGALQEELPLTEEEFFAGFDPETIIAAEGLLREPRFNQAEQWQAARSVRLGLTFRFE